MNDNNVNQVEVEEWEEFAHGPALTFDEFLALYLDGQ